MNNQTKWELRRKLSIETGIEIMLSCKALRAYDFNYDKAKENIYKFKN